MRAVQVTVLLVIPVLFWSCGDGHGGHSQRHEAGVHEPAGESYGLRLNGGEKWRMDDHTRAMFAVMVERIEGRAAEIEPSSSLGSALRKDIDELIAGCTMTGQSHDELHKLLIAFIPAVEELALQGGDEALTAVKKILDSYPRYFE